MSDAFIESNTNVYRNSVTFITGFGIVADQPFTIGNLTSTNSNLVTYNTILPWGGISGFSNSGEVSDLSARLFQTGDALGSRLFQTGFDLRALITAANNGVATINGMSGVIDIVGTGEIYVQNIGQLIVISGNSGDYATKYFLTATGANLYNLINNFSGVFNNSGTSTQSQINSLTTNLTTTGHTLYNYIVSLSGIENNTISDLQTTGSILSDYIISMSGDIENTGLILDTKISNWGVKSANAISGDINISGINKIQVRLSGSDTIFISGVDLVDSSQTGQFYPASNPNNYSTSGNLQTSGSNLYNYINNFSGIFNSTGVAVQTQFSTLTNNLITTGSTLYTLLINDSGQFNTRLFSTGSTLSTILNNYTGYINNNPSGFINDHNDGINLSGKLTITGQTLYNYITSTSGNLDTRLYQTGNTLLGLINAASAGVSSIGGKSGVLTLTGAGNVTIIVDSQTLTVSGDTGIYSTFYQNSNPNNYATSGNLQTTGSNLYNYINNFSGVFNNSGIQYQSQINTLVSNLILTGQTLWNFDTSLSGNLFSTGNTLDSKINSLSGYSNNNFVTISSLNNYGVKSLNNISGSLFISGTNQIQIVQSGNNTLFVSGVDIATTTNVTNTGITLLNIITNSGAYLYNSITGFSGVFNSSGAQYQSQINTLTTNLADTGSKTWNDSNSNGINLSGNLATTGQNLYFYVTNTSGNLSTRLYQTGVDLIALINSSAGAVSSLNNASGIISITGKGNVAVISGGVGLIYVSGDTGTYSTFYQNSNPNNYPTSGNLQSTGQNLYQDIIGLSGLLSGNIQSTGQNILTLLANTTGYMNTNPSGFALASNLQTTGSTLDNKINVLSGYSDGYLVHRINNESITGNKSFVNDISANAVTATYIYGSTIQGNSAPNSYINLNSDQLIAEDELISLNWNSRTLSGTWNAQAIRVSGASLITGIDTSSFITTGQTGQFYSASNPQNYTTSGNLQSTGQTLYNLINNYTGYQNTNPSGFLTQATVNNFITTGAADNRFVHLTGNETITGIKTFRSVTYIDNSLYTSGSIILRSPSELLADSLTLRNIVGGGLYLGTTDVGAGIDTVTIGLRQDSDGDRSTVIGRANITNTSDSVIVGNLNDIGNVTSGYKGYVFGYGNAVSQNNTGFGIFGNDNQMLVVGKNNILAIGTNNIIGENNNAAIGFGLINSIANSMDIGVNEASKITIDNDKVRIRTSIISTGISGLNITGHNLKVLNNLTVSNQSNFNGLAVCNGGLEMDSQISFVGEFDPIFFDDGEYLDFQGSFKDANLIYAISPVSRTLQDSNGNTSANWSLRRLYTGSNLSTTLDWSGRILSGDWSTLGTLRISGQSVITGVDTSLWATALNLQSTGTTLYNYINNFSGVFNNSGTQYQNSINTLTTNLTTTGQTLLNLINTPPNAVYTTGDQNINGLKIFSGAYFTGAFSGINLTGYNLKVLNNLNVTGAATFENSVFCRSTVTSQQVNSVTNGSFISLLNGIIYDDVSTASISWVARELNDDGETVTLNWNTKNLVGSWTAQDLNATSTLKISGQSVITGGSFYANNNPSGFIISGEYYRPTQAYNLILDWRSGNVFTHSLTGNVNFVHTGHRDGQTVVARVQNTGLTWWSGTWSGSDGVQIRWPSDIPFQQTSGKTDVLTFIKIGTGLIYANAVQGFTN